MRAGANSILGDDLLIEPGSFVVVCGLTESGKSAFLHGLAPAENDADESADESAGDTSRIGVVSDENEAYDHTDSPFFADMASLLGVTEWTDSDPTCLSGGQRQRLALARQMANQMPSFVLDEPTAHLDPATAWLLLRFLINLNQEQGATVVISDRHLEELFPICKRVLFFLKDRIVYDGDVQNFIVKASASAAAFTTALPANVTIPLIRHMKTTADQGHDAMAGTYLIAKYPLSVPEARKRLEIWPEVKLQQATKDEVEGAAADTDSADAVDTADAAIATTATAATTTATAATTTVPILLKAGGLTLRSGEITACIGDNGSGKTRLLEALCEEAANNNLTTLFLHQELRSGENQLTALRHILSQAEAEIAARTTAITEDPATVEISKPGILLLDEPVAAVDAATAQKQSRRITAIRDAGWAVVIATQNLDFAATITDFCVMVTSGKPSEPLLPQDFFDNALLYTTVVNRVTRGLLDHCVNLGDLKAYL
ncbi:MAG: ATP-binding cassette domain-containing protein [Coriobacteriales bacterium]|jgi:ABC-type multidrug transport system ATPase subunit|nr:ATP-binding cassette domain-containing protein [Coriobacteriales bacterium]